MFRTIMTIIATVIGVLFSIQNFDHVPVFLFSGKAVNIRLIFVIAISGLLGYLIRHITGIAKEDRLKRQIQHLLRRKKGNKTPNGSSKNGSNVAVWDDDDDDDI